MTASTTASLSEQRTVLSSVSKVHTKTAHTLPDDTRTTCGAVYTPTTKCGMTRCQHNLLHVKSMTDHPDMGTCSDTYLHKITLVDGSEDSD